MVADVYRRAGRALLVNFLVVAVLLATHLGEFWPFSILPMFSRAGNPWQNVVVREVDGPEAPGIWEVRPVEEVAGKPFPVVPAGIQQRDLAKMIKEVDTWSPTAVANLRRMLAPFPDSKWLMVVRVVGDATDDGVIVTRAEPFILLGPDGHRTRPGAEGAP